MSTITKKTGRARVPDREPETPGSPPAVNLNIETHKPPTSSGTASGQPEVDLEALGVKPAQVPNLPDFDLEALRLPLDFHVGLGVKELLVTLRVNKPMPAAWVRVHPDPEYRIATYVIDLKEERETYLVDPRLWKGLQDEQVFGYRMLALAQTRQGMNFIWPVRLPGPDGRLDEWSQSAQLAMQQAQTDWVRVKANMSKGSYDVAVSTANWPAPVWPEQPFKDLLKLGFREKYIADPNHPVLQRLRGEA